MVVSIILGTSLLQNIYGYKNRVKQVFDSLHKKPYV